VNNKIRYFIYLWAFLYTLPAFAQVKDRRANLPGGGTEISVSPDGKIWLVDRDGNTYYTEHIDSLWHLGKSWHVASSGINSESPGLDRISFFNKDTAIITGYIATNKENIVKDGYYLTMDGAKTWKLLNFGGDCWIYNTFVDKKGNAWMGGSSGEIFFSSNYGQHWQKLNSPFDQSSRMNSIFMLNSSVGIAGALENDIYMTGDNWKTYKRIATPLDQKKYPREGSNYEERINKIILWNNYIVVQERGRNFYTKSDIIEWTSFPQKIYNFELDRESNKLFVVTDSLQVLTCSSPKRCQLLTDKQLPGSPLSMKVVDRSLYVQTDARDICKVDKTGIKVGTLYTTDIKIAEPEIVKQGKKLTWGADWHRLYLAEDTIHDWYREKIVNFPIYDLVLQSDSIARLWSGKDNYIYSLKDHSIKDYVLEAPINAFLSSPINAFVISSGSTGCFHHTETAVRYNRKDNYVFKATGVTGNGLPESTIFTNSLNGNQLISILAAINSDPSGIPSIKDFKITEGDIKKYLALVDTQWKYEDVYSNRKKINKAFYYSVPKKLDTLSRATIKNALSGSESVYSTTSNWFSIQFVNENNDTVSCSSMYYTSPYPWSLPWQIDYKDLKFKCYSIELSKFINSCIPNDFQQKKVFDNSLLIMQFARYLWNNENQ